MKHRLFLTLFIFSLSLPCFSQNTLTAAEKKAGWKLLFDGKTTTGWRGAFAKEFPKQGWVVQDGEIRGELAEGKDRSGVGDLVTTRTYRNFELVFDWKLGELANSGVKYFVIDDGKPMPGVQPGYEYQMIDDANYIYNDKHLPADLKTASLYDVIPAKKADTKMNQWHTSKIVVRQPVIEHWLDGKKVMETDRTSSAFKAGFEDSKFNKFPGYTTIQEGHILLQDHGHSVAFRNLKIKELP
jgi:hypothetical protein